MRGGYLFIIMFQFFGACVAQWPFSLFLYMLLRGFVPVCCGLMVMRTGEHKAAAWAGKCLAGGKRRIFS